MSSLWRQSRSLRNESKVFTATINKSKEPKSPVGNFFDFIKQWWLLISGFFDFIKQWWLLISGGFFALIIALMVGGYSFAFSGDIGASIEYVQAYVFSGGTIKVALYLVLAVLVFTAILFLPAHASRWLFEEKWQGKSILKRILWAGVVYTICIVGALFAGLIFTFLSGGYSTAPSTAIYFYIYFFIAPIALVTYFIILVPIFLGILKNLGFKEKRSLHSWTTGFIVALIMIITLWQPANVLLLINGGNSTGYMACVSDNRNTDGKSEFFKKTVIPVSYDSRGVQVFAGDYNDKTKKWSNVRREYLYFNEGYEVKLGKACPERAEGK